MSGTPVLSTLVDGLAGARPNAVRGIVNATANFILTRMEEGASYEDALREAQELGLAERDATADAEGYDAMAKAMISRRSSSAGSCAPRDVVRRGITRMNRAQIEAARSDGAHVKQLVTLDFLEAGGVNDVAARVEPSALPRGDSLARISGVVNAIVYHAEPVGEVMLTGPGAGPELAGQGVFSDLIAVARDMK